MLILPFDHSNDILTLQTKPSFPCGQAECHPGYHCLHRSRVAERRPSLPTVPGQSLRAKGAEGVRTLLLKERNAKSSFKMQWVNPCLQSSKTHFRAFTTKKWAPFVVPWTPYFLKDDHPTGAPPTRNGKRRLARGVLTVRFHKCHSRRWHLNAAEFSVNRIGKGPSQARLDHHQHCGCST